MWYVSPVSKGHIQKATCDTSYIKYILATRHRVGGWEVNIKALWIHKECTLVSSPAPASLPLKEHVILCKRKQVAMHNCFLSYAYISCTPSPPSALHVPHLPLGDQPSWSTSHSQPVPNTCQVEQGGAHHFQESGWGVRTPGPLWGWPGRKSH